MNSIKNFPHIKKVTTVHNQAYNFFLNKLYMDWTLDDFGPLKVPNKGMVIEFNKVTYFLYKQLLIDYEHLSVEEINGKYYVEGKQIKKFVLKNNYYFVMGDNRGSSVDSRYFGFICEKLIVGKVKIVMFSHLEGKFRWDRFLKFIN